MMRRALFVTAKPATPSSRARVARDDGGLLLAEPHPRPYDPLIVDARTAPDLAPRKLVAFAASLVCVEWAITRTALFHRGGAVPIAVLFDLVLGLPLVFALAILRPAKRSPLLAAPVQPTPHSRLETSHRARAMS
jgi:hypothetical protein